MANDSSLFLEVIAPTGLIFEGEVDSVSLPAYNGTITVLPHHTPLFTKLLEGEVEIKSKGKDISIVISGGFLEIQNNKARVLSDYAVRAESIEIAKTEEKKRQAESKLKEKLDERDFTIADKDLKMSILELKISQKIRKKQRIQ